MASHEWKFEDGDELNGDAWICVRCGGVRYSKDKPEDNSLVTIFNTYSDPTGQSHGAYTCDEAVARRVMEC